MLLPLLMLMLGPAADAGGGGVANNDPIPPYYSQKVEGEKVSLPQDQKSNEVAQEVLKTVTKLEKKLPKKQTALAKPVKQARVVETKMLDWVPAPIRKIEPQKPFKQVVLETVIDIEARLDAGDMDFDAMLKQVDWMLKQVAIYVESQQTYDLVRSIEMQIKAYRDT